MLSTHKSLTLPEGRFLVKGISVQRHVPARAVSDWKTCLGIQD